jgi:hypothetical protein
MNSYPLEIPAPVLPASPLNLSLLLGKRVANIVLTAQVQMAYACAKDAQARAVRARECIEKTWPATPVRALVLDGYQAQAQSAGRVAQDVLQGAQRRCGLAFARY